MLLMLRLPLFSVSKTRHDRMKSPALGILRLGRAHGLCFFAPREKCYDA
jgi:hypothetical protein